KRVFKKFCQAHPDKKDEHFIVTLRSHCLRILTVRTCFVTIYVTFLLSFSTTASTTKTYTLKHTLCLSTRHYVNDALRFCIGYDCIEWRNKRGSICSCKKCFVTEYISDYSSIGAK